ncbi:MAG: hypothetical protein Q8S17_12530, partial [Humidesulfovibrio sp.]|nr:hypothetical protein [Humidesulfovibrio sp.]
LRGQAGPGLAPQQDHRLHEAEEARLLQPQELKAFAFPSGHARLLSRMLADVRLEGLLSPAS